MKNNIIMWSEPDAIERANLIDALKCATVPIREAMEWFEWEGEHLTCGPATLQEGKEHWRNLYFYLSGYGDAQFQNCVAKERKQPLAIPQSTKAENMKTYYGCFDGLRGLEIEMSLDDALSASHQGECWEDVQALVRKPAIAAQLDKIGEHTIRQALKESGGWDESELSDSDSNRKRAVWMAVCDIRENHQSTTKS